MWQLAQGLLPRRTLRGSHACPQPLDGDAVAEGSLLGTVSSEG